MRIRRRPPGQPLAYLLPSDPYPAPQSPPPPPRASPSIDHAGNSKQQGEGEELHLLHPAADDSAADLGDARASSPLRRPALPPQDGAVEVERSTGLGLGPGPGAQQQQQEPASESDGRSRSSLLENGHGRRHVPEPVTTIQAAGERISNNGVVSAAAAATTTGGKTTTKKHQKQETKDTSGGTKRAPRGSGVLMEGSRCSRKNGRGWRCSQPTMMGYALCQYHLGKGRMKSGSAAAAGGRGPGQLGRTEHGKKSSAVARAPPAVTAAASDVPPPPRSVQHC